MQGSLTSLTTFCKHAGQVGLLQNVASQQDLTTEPLLQTFRLPESRLEAQRHSFICILVRIVVLISKEQNKSCRPVSEWA